MARKKTILKENILETAYHVLRIEGFKGFTARNIAKRMECSTQPIYLEFKNMDDLKNELMEKVYTYLTEEVYNRPRTGDPLADFCVNYIEFAHDEKVFFASLFLENQLDACVLHQFAHQSLMQVLNTDVRTMRFSSEEKKKLYERVWPTVHGTASMVAQGMLGFDEAGIVEVMHCLLSEVKETVGLKTNSYRENQVASNY